MEVKQIDEIAVKVGDLGKKYESGMKSATDRLDGLDGRMDALCKKMDDMKAMQTAGSAPQSVSEEVKSLIQYMGGVINKGEVKKANPADTAAVLNPANGGVLAVEDYVRQVQLKMVNRNPVLNEVAHYTTTANILGIPVERGVPDAYFVGELQTATATKPKLGIVNLAVKQLTCRVPMSRVLLADSNLVSAETYAVGRTAEVMGWKEEKSIIAGDGVTQPEGIINNKTVIKNAKKTGAASGVTRDALIEALMALPEDTDGNAKWLMSRSTFASVVNALGTNSVDIAYGYTRDIPRMLFGKPVVLCESMPALTQTAKPAIIVGDLRKGYASATNGGMEFLRDDYTGWADGVVYMNMWSQFGGVVVDPDAFVGLIPGE